MFYHIYCRASYFERDMVRQQQLNSKELCMKCKSDIKYDLPKEVTASKLRYFINEIKTYFYVVMSHSYNKHKCSMDVA